MIFDNADDKTLNLETYFLRANHGNIIITTQSQIVRNHASPTSSVNVSRMRLKDATDLLLNVSGLDSENKGAAAAFVEESDLLIMYGNHGAEGYNRN